MPPKGCHGRNTCGSGYVKPDSKDSKINDDVKKMMDARAQQDAQFFPTLPTAAAFATSGAVATAPRK